MEENGKENDDISIKDIEEAGNIKGELNYELLVSKHVNRILIFREINVKQYGSSIDGLMLILMKDIKRLAERKREQLGLGERIDGQRYCSFNDEKQLKYDQLFSYINELLEDSNVIFRKSSFKHGKDKD